jgi:predicted metal-dependent enzyme (double-stranded beta helix superfamily)
MSDDRGDHGNQSWPWPPELDALVAAPNSHRLLLDHARVRVLEVTVPPGVTEPMHTHRFPSVMVVLGLSG